MLDPFHLLKSAFPMIITRASLSAKDGEYSSDATKRAWRRLKKLAGIKMILPAGECCHFPARVKS